MPVAVVRVLRQPALLGAPGSCRRRPLRAAAAPSLFAAYASASSPSSPPRPPARPSVLPLPPPLRRAMSSQPPSQGARPPVDAGGVAEPRPSASVLLLSAANEVLLLHRVKSSTSFASAHVFPGGNLDAFHDGEVPPPGSPDRHRDGPAYRLAAVRECFEETGILLAKKGGTLVNLPASTRDEMRVKIHANKVSFADWVRSLGAEPDSLSTPPPPPPGPRLVAASSGTAWNREC